jgi:serine/threonine protein kinase/WD40 repeat protein/tetratricopeptide (TPR) repeat protein
MPPSDPTSSASRNPVELLAEEFVDRQRRGEHPSISEYAARHPELAETIRRLFPALRMLENLKPAQEGADPSGNALRPSPTQLGQSTPCLGEYRLLREIARGGMGVVYEAVQESLGRHVALKVLPRHRWLSPTQIERFQLEARSAARLHHGHIVPVYGVGEHEGVHYYAMQFIHGHGLDVILDDLRRLRGLGQALAKPNSGDEGAPASGGETGSRTPAFSLLRSDVVQSQVGARPVAEPKPELEPPATSSSLSLAADSQFCRSAARIGLQVADALAYAHEQGVLHRDIKPSNLLLDAVGNAWVTDFGLAKLEGSDGPTHSGDIVGTVRYMAPERFDRWSDRRSDVSSLGATLYELLTLRPMFAGAREPELIEKVLHTVPERPRRLDPKIPRDLETIVLKAIAKEPGDRYPTAGALAEDLRRFLEDRPVLARRSTTLERTWRWCRRNPLLAGATMVAAAAFLMLSIGAHLAAWTYRDQFNQIRRAETQVRENLFDALTAQARAGRFSRRIGQRFESLYALDRAAKIGRDLKWPAKRFDRLRDEAIACLALPDLKPTGRVIHRPPGVIASAFNPAMTRAALRFRDGTIQVRRAAADQELACFQASADHEVSIFGFSPDGRYLATRNGPDASLLVWDIARGERAINVPGAARRSVRFTPDSRRIAMARDDGSILVVDLTTSQTVGRWRVHEPGDLAFRFDGAQLAVISHGQEQSTCQILDADSGRLVRSIPLSGTAVGLAWSPDGATLATPCENRKIYLWDAPTGAQKGVLERHTNGGLRATFHPAGTLLASCGWDDRLWLWDPVLVRPWLSFSGGAPGDWQFSSDGRIVLSLEDQLTTYQVDPALEYRTLAHVAAPPIVYGHVALHRDGRLLALGTDQGASLWDLARNTELAFLPIDNATNVLFEPSGDLLTSGALGVWRWPIHTDPGRDELRVGPPCQLLLPAGNCGISEDFSGQVVAKAASGVAQVITPTRKLQVGPLADCRSVAVSPDGQWLATGSHGKNGAQVWRLGDTTQVAALAIEGLIGVLFSADGKWLMTTYPPCRLWAVGTWHQAQQIGGRGLCFSAEGDLLLVQEASKVLRLVEPRTGRTLAQLESPDACDVWSATFSADGSVLAVSTNDGPAIHIWDLGAIRRRLAEMGLDWDAAPLAAADCPTVKAKGAAPVKVKVDFGPLKRYHDQYESHLEQYTVPTEQLIAGHTERLRTHPDDMNSLHQRAHALLWLRRYEETLADFSRAAAQSPRDAHLQAYQGISLLTLGKSAPALERLEPAFQTDPETVRAIVNLELLLNSRAWELASGANPKSNPTLAARLAAFSVALAPGVQLTLNTLGVALYRAGKMVQAIETLEKSLKAANGGLDGFDLFFLAMAHHRLGHRAEARACFGRGVRWLNQQIGLSENNRSELAAIRAEAEAVLAGAGAELPQHLFTPPQ